MSSFLVRAAIVGVAALVVVLLPFHAQRLPPGPRARASRIYFIAILGLNILIGYTGQISIGHGAFMAIGGYTTAILSHDHHWNLLATLPASFAHLLRRRRPRRPAGAPALQASTSRSRRSRSPSRCRSCR